MSSELLKRTAVRISVTVSGNAAIYGSGVIAQNKDGSYFVITAEHCINGKRGKRLENVSAEDIKIEFKEANTDQFTSIKINKILYANEKKDLALLSIESLNGQTDNIIYSKLDRESDCKAIKFRGFPKWLQGKNEAKTFDCGIEEVDNDTFIVKTAEVLDLSLQKSIEETSSGLSGSGVFDLYNKKLYLIGIVSELRTADGAFGHIKCAKLDAIFDQNNFEAGQLSNRDRHARILIKKEDKADFIGDLVLEEDYLERRLTEEYKSQAGYYNENRKGLTISEKLDEFDNLFILGNPGSGKSTELKKLAEMSWKEGWTTDYVPVFKTLRNFTKSKELEDYLPSRWSELNKVLLILDGIDEISEIEPFKTKLENFVIANARLKKDIKYVLSCRTNIFESLVFGLQGFSTFYLQDLTVNEGIGFLTGKGIDFEYDPKLDAFLKNPFLAGILADYIMEEGKNPTSTAGLWKTYIDKRLAHDKKDKLVKLSINVMLIKKISEKTSFINELRKTNIIEEECLFKVLEKNHLNLDEFAKNPLMEKLAGTEDWTFEHKNIQEYFAAKALSELSFKKIKKNIIIQGTNKTHPTLFNTITFLINILEGKKYAELVGWLIENEPELLFKADSGRTEIFREKVFQHYFKSECVDKNLWITTNKTFGEKEIAVFGNSPANFDYLLDFINAKDSSVRVVLSALKLLRFFEIPDGRTKEVKEWCLNILKEKDKDPAVKSNIIGFITLQKLIENDRLFLDAIFNALKGETNKEINSSLLFMVRDLDNIDFLFPYLKEEFKRVHRIVKRNDDDNVHRGNSWVLNELILKIKNSDFFIELISHYFFDSCHIELHNTHAIEIVEKCLLFDAEEDDFLLRFIKSVNGKTDYYRHERLLAEIIGSEDNKLMVAEYLLQNSSFSEVRRFIAAIAVSETLKLVVKNIVAGTITPPEADIFLRNLWHHNAALSREFEEFLIKNNLKAEKELLTEIELTDKQAKNNVRHQHNFDILFKKEELLEEIKKIFEENGSAINDDEIFIIEDNFFRVNGHWGVMDTSLKILQTLLYEYRSVLTFEDTKELLQNDFILFKKIEEFVKGNTNSNKRFKVSDDQQKAIVDWCVKASQSIDLNQIIDLVGENSYHYSRDYWVLKTIFDFQELFDFELPQKFLLECIEYFEIENFTGNEMIFDKLLSRIGNKDLFDEKIIKNLLDKKPLFNFVKERHVNYVLRNKLKPAYAEVRNYFIEIKPGYNLEEKLEAFIDLKADTELLKECCKNVEEPKCWSAVKILLKINKEADFCASKAIEYLEVSLAGENKFYLWDAMSVLFQLNRKEAIVYYSSFIAEDRVVEAYYSNYDVEDYATFEKIFFKTYGKNAKTSYFNNSGAFLSSYVINLARKEASYSKIKEVLYSIKSKLNMKEHDSELFYINILIDNCEASYINSKSLPMSFEEALKKVNKIMN